MPEKITVIDGSLEVYFLKKYFNPKKFLSYFTKSYGQKMMAQTAISGGISNILNLFMRLIKGIQ